MVICDRCKKGTSRCKYIVGVVNINGYSPKFIGKTKQDADLCDECAEAVSGIASAAASNEGHQPAVVIHPRTSWLTLTFALFAAGLLLTFVIVGVRWLVTGHPF